MPGLYNVLRQRSVASARELQDLWRLPSADLDHLVDWEPCRFLPPSQDAFVPPGARRLPRPGSTVAGVDDHWITLGRGERPDGTLAPVGLLLRDLLPGTIISAPPGTGKTHLGKIILDGTIRAGAGFSLIDFKSDFTHDMLQGRIPRAKEALTAVVDLTDTAWPIALNPFVQPHVRARGVIADSILTLISRFDPGFAEGVRMIEFTRNACLALVEVAEHDAHFSPNLLQLHRFMRSEAYRAHVVGAHVRDPLIREFWLHDFPNRSPQEQAGIEPVLRRLGIFLMNPIVRHMVCRPRTTLDFREAMDAGHYVLASLPVETIGAQLAEFASVMLQELLTNAAFSRSADHVPVELRTVFVNMVDEFHTAVQRSDPVAFLNQISKGRAMGLATILLYQASAQLPPELREQMESVMSNLVCLGALGGDVATLLRRWGTRLTADDLMGMRRREDLYLQYQVNEHATGVFRAQALPLPPPPEQPPLGLTPATPWRAVRAVRTAEWQSWLDVRYDDLQAYEAAATEARTEARRLRSHALLLRRGATHEAHQLRDVWERASAAWPREAADQLAQAAMLEAQAAAGEATPVQLLLAAPPEVWARYQERAAEHRAAQRAFLLAHPAALPNDAERIMTLSRLQLAAPALEVEAYVARTVRELAADDRPRGDDRGKRKTPMMVARGAVIDPDALQPQVRGLRPWEDDQRTDLEVLKASTPVFLTPAGTLAAVPVID